jgi:hypothetical protein
MATKTLCSQPSMQQSAGAFMAIETVCMQPAEVGRKAGNTKTTAMPIMRAF